MLEDKVALKEGLGSSAVHLGVLRGGVGSYSHGTDSWGSNSSAYRGRGSDWVQPYREKRVYDF